jgi:hypothetical protein
MAWISSPSLEIDRLYTMAENMTENAKYIFSFFRKNGWTSNSICGMLGNMQAESGIIADRDEVGGGAGYGLVQWTPKSRLTTWANEHRLNYRTVDTQCKRIQWELENGQQFYATTAYPMDFRQFTQSTKSPAYLAEVFIHNYERPANPNQPQRGVWAENWYRALVGEEILTGEDEMKIVLHVGDKSAWLVGVPGVGAKHIPDSALFANLCKITGQKNDPSTWPIVDGVTLQFLQYAPPG